MIHSAETIKRLRTLLADSGVPKGEMLEEMLDHYLSDIEWQRERQIPLQTATQNTFEKIRNTDFSHLRQKKKSSLPFVLASIFLLGFALYFQQSYLHTKKEEIVESPKEIKPDVKLIKEEKAPDGWPLKGDIAPVASNFGMRMHPVLKSLKLHKGIDIRARAGAAVLATGNAVVKETGFGEKAGNYIILEHNGRFSSRYNHLSAIHVKKGDVVAKGAIIGEVGSTGASLGPHLHYEIIDSGAPIDPLECVRM
jgi:murein DD-endopeptidase MepM/ murein hydrolase activator NlpD